MKNAVLAVCIAVATSVMVLGLAPRWLGERQVEAKSLSSLSQGEDDLGAVLPTPYPIEREVASGEPVDEPPAVAETTPITQPTYQFLPFELAVLSTRVPVQLEEFNRSSGAERLKIGRELLVQSVAVIMCATGAGPIEKGIQGDGDLSHAGKNGRWSFQVNGRTFHFHELEYPEYRELMTAFTLAFDENSAPRTPDVGMSEELAEKIRLRAQEALAWL